MSGPSAEQEVEHLADQCATLLRENEELRIINADLLEALKRCADKLEKCAIFSGTAPEYAAVAVEEFRTAIAKAKGKMLGDDLPGPGGIERP